MPCRGTLDTWRAGILFVVLGGIFPNSDCGAAVAEADAVAKEWHEFGASSDAAGLLPGEPRSYPAMPVI